MALPHFISQPLGVAIGSLICLQAPPTHLSHQAENPG